MPEYLSNKKRKQSIGINSYSEYTDTTKIIGNVLVGFGSVGVGTTVPTQDVDVNTIRVRDTLFDYTNSGGEFGYYLVKDTDGIKWVAVPPIDSNAIFVAENNNILGVSSFTGLNIIADELLGVTPNPINPNFADITILPRWLKSGETGIYTTKNVGIGTTIPTTDFQVGFGTTGVTIDGSVGVVSALGYYGNYAFIDQITVNDQLNVVGLGSTLVAAFLGSGGGITTTGGDLYVGGTLFADKLDIINLKVVNIEATGITTLNVGIVSTFRVTGVSTLGVTSTKDLFVDANLEVSGITTLGITSTKDLFVDENLYVVGIATATRFSTGVTGSAINITSNTISGPAEIIIDPADVSDNSGAVRIKGDLYVDGEEFIVNSTTIELADFNVGIASTVGTNFLLDGAGIGIGSTNIRKTLTYDFSSDALKSSENFDLETGKVYKINETEVLSSTLLTVANINATGVSTLGFATIGQLYVSGVSTFVGVGTFINDLYVGRNLYVADDIFFDELTARNANITGITTLNVGIVSTFRVTGVSTLGVTSISQLYVSGLSTFVGVGTFINDLYVGEVLYADVVTGLTSTRDLLVDGNLRVTGITTLGVATISQLNVSGVTTLGVTSATNLTSQQLIVSGITTLGVTSATNLTSQQLIVSGITTLGITTAQQLYVSGVSTFVGVGTFIDDLYVGKVLYAKTVDFDNIEVENIKATGISTLNVGIVSTLTVTGVSTLGVTSATNLTSQQLNVSGITTLGITTLEQLYVSGVSTFSDRITGIISTATKLENQRTFEITGDVVASPIFFDGTGNVSLAATIQPNSVGLGTDTFGDYVKDIIGTANEIIVTGGTGEGSSPTLSIPNQFTAPQDVTVSNDLQVNRNLNVNGNITIGGTSAILFTQTFKVYDSDIILGVRTDGNGNDISTDNTANHGGIAIASTDGNPLIILTNQGIGETLPATYKKFMWFKAGSFAGLGTDAWLSNYAIGIGSTQFPTGTRLAAGSVQFTENDLAVVRNINASGIITATEFKGTLTGYASSAGITTHIRGGDAGNVVYQSAPDTTTFVNNSSAAPNQVLLWDGATPYWGYVDAGSVAGIVTYAERAGIAVTVIGGIASVTSLNVTGITTLGTIEISSGIVTAKAGTGIVTYYGDGSYLTGVSAFSVQQQDITTSPVYPTFASNIGTSSLGIAATELVYIPASGNLGIGTTSPTSKLTVVGDVLISGVLTATRLYSGIYGEFVGGSISGSDIVGTSLSITGISTIANFIMTPVGTGATVGGIGVTYYGDGSQLTNVVSTSGYADTAGVSTTSGYATNAGIATYADTAGVSTISGYATNAGIATYADTAGVSTTSGYATSAGIATYADTSGISTTSGYATNAGVSTTSNYATSAGIATYADTAGVSTTSGYATNAGIATYADTAGVSTTSGYATNAGIATYADTAGVSTTSGYSTSAGIATYADTAGVSTTSNYATNAGVSTTSGYSTSAGIATYADTAGVSTTSNYATNAGVSTTSGYSTSAGIATYADTSGISTIATNVIGGIASVTSLDVSGITTLGSVEISSGIVTAKTGIVTYYGDGSYLTGVSAFSVQQQDIISSPIYPTFASNIGVSSISIVPTQVAYIPASGNLGIGTTTPTSKLTVVGDVLVSGVLTATRLYSGIYGEFVGGSISGSEIVGTSLSITGISTLGTVKISSGIITSTTGIVTYYGDGSNLTNVVGAFGGIGTAGGTVGTGITFLDFRGSGISSITVSSGIATITIPGASRSVNSYVATEGQTTFAATYSVGYADVYLNGSKLSDTEYIATNGTSIELTEGASAGDIVEIVSYLINITGGSSTPDISPVMMGMIF